MFSLRYIPLTPCPARAPRLPGCDSLKKSLSTPSLSSLLGSYTYSTLPAFPELETLVRALSPTAEGWESERSHLSSQPQLTVDETYEGLCSELLIGSWCIESYNYHKETRTGIKIPSRAASVELILLSDLNYHHICGTFCKTPIVFPVMKPFQEQLSILTAPDSTKTCNFYSVNSNRVEVFSKGQYEAKEALH